MPHVFVMTGRLTRVGSIRMMVIFRIGRSWSSISGRCWAAI